MRRMLYEHASHLFRTGEFGHLVECFQNVDDVEDLDPRVRMLVGHAAALNGDSGVAQSAIDIAGTNRLPPDLRSQREMTLGLVSKRAGDPRAAWTHLNAAVQHAND